MIVATAIPKISDDFHSVQDIGWYGAAFLLTTCACQLLYGKLYSTFSVKGTFLTSVILFEIGSAICGAAPTSICLIIGRAIQGIGGAGVFSGGVCGLPVDSLHHLPLLLNRCALADRNYCLRRS